MKKTCLSKVFKSFIFLFAFFLLALPVKAQETMSLTATPVRLGDDFSISLKPGEKKQVQVKVRNGSSGAVSLESAALDFIVGEDGESPIVVDMEEQDNRWSLASWITLAPAFHDLDTEEIAAVNVLIEVPEDALPGGHYAMIYHRPVDSVTEEVTGSGISQRVGTLLYVLVEGDINEEAYISNFNWPKFMENGPVDFSVVIDNQSDVHIRTKPVVKIYNLFGKEVDSIELDSKNIFPMTTRDFLGEWDRVWGFGPYKALLEVAYGSQGQLLSSEAVLWLFPVKITLLVLIVLLLILILILSLRKKNPPTGTAETVVKNQVVEDEKNNASETPADLPEKKEEA